LAFFLGAAALRSRSSQRRAIRPGACVFEEDAMRPASEARILWDRSYDPTVLVAAAVSTDPHDEQAFDLCRQAVPTTLVVVPGGAEEVLLGRGAWSIRLSIVRGTLRDGPVRLEYALRGLVGLDAPILTLRRLLALQRDGGFSSVLFPALSRGRRWAMLVRTLDALAIDPGQKAVATALYGAATVAAEWNGRSDFLRSRVRRLIKQARSLAAGGYIDLLRTPPRLP
jgi:hypothetical protein